MHRRNAVDRRKGRVPTRKSSSTDMRLSTMTTAIGSPKQDSNCPEEVPVPAKDEAEARAARLEKEAHDLTNQISFLEEEVSTLRRRIAESPRQVRSLEERLSEAQASLAGVSNQNERLASTLKEARDQIVALKEEVDRLA